MPASFPNSIKNFGDPEQNSIDIVDADHVNEIRDEVAAIEDTLGTGLKASTFTGTFSQTTSWSNLSNRLINIERGLVSTSDIHPQYVKKAGDTLSGSLVMGSNKIAGLADGTDAADAVNKSQLDPVSTAALAALPKSGGTMSGPIAMGSSKITGLANGTSSADAVNVSQLNTKLNLSGGTMTGNIAMGGNKLTGLGTPTSSGDAATKSYVDTLRGQIVGGVIYAPGGNDPNGGYQPLSISGANAGTILVATISTNKTLYGVGEISIYQRWYNNQWWVGHTDENAGRWIHWIAIV